MSATLPRYTRPTLQRHRAGAMNKMGALPALQAQDRVDGVPVAELVAAHGSPLFVYSERTLRKKIRALRAAFAGRWPAFQPAWSYKTCYLDAVVRVFHDEGAWAEAVSGMEVDKALRNGVPMERVIFNGPYKEPAALERAILGGALVNVDHFDELAAIERIAAAHDRVPAVGLRVNLAAGSAPRWDRFGFNLDNGQAWDAVRRLVAGGRLRLSAIHCHVGTFILDPDVYRVAAEKIALFANRLREELGIRLDTIDLGGGFASTSRLKAQYLPGDQVTPSFEDYAVAITDGLGALRYEGDPLPRLVLETGRALVDEAGTLITTVVASKRLADGRRALVADAGVNLLYTSTWYRHEIVPAQPVAGTPEPSVVYGPLCMNIDVVCEHQLLPPFEAGHLLLLKNVGAYNVTQSMQFIHLRPAIVMVGEGGQVGVIRRAETLEELAIGEEVPEWIGDRPALRVAATLRS